MQEEYQGIKLLTLNSSKVIQNKLETLSLSLRRHSVKNVGNVGGLKHINLFINFL